MSEDVLAGNLITRIKADLADWTVNISAARKDLDGFVAAVDRNKVALLKCGAAITAVGASITLIMGKASKEAATSETVFNRLKTTVEQYGYKWKDAERNITNYTTKLSKMTRYTDEQVASSLSKAMNITGNLGKSMTITTLALNMASAGMGSVESSTIMLSRAMGGNLMLLGRLYPELNETTNELLKNMTASEKAAYAIDFLTKKYKDFAEKELATTEVKFINMNKSINEFQESIGKNMNPVLNTFFDKVTNLVYALKDFIDTHENLTKTLVLTASAFGLILTALGGLMVGVASLPLLKATLMAVGFTLGSAGVGLIGTLTILAGTIYTVSSNWKDLNNIASFFVDIWNKMPHNTNLFLGGPFGVKPKPKTGGFNNKDFYGTASQDLGPKVGGEAGEIEGGNYSGTRSELPPGLIQGGLEALWYKQRRMTETNRRMDETYIKASTMGNLPEMMATNKALGRQLQQGIKDSELQIQEFDRTIAKLHEGDNSTFARLKNTALETFKVIGKEMKWQLENVAYWFNKDVLVGGWRNAFNNLRNTAADAAADIGAQLMLRLEAESLTYFYDTLYKKVFKTIVDGIWDAFWDTRVGQAISGFGSKLGNVMKNLAKWIYDAFIDPIVQLGITAFQLAFKAAVGLAKWIYDAFLDPIIAGAINLFVLAFKGAILLSRWIYDALLSDIVKNGIAFFASMFRGAFLLANWIYDAMINPLVDFAKDNFVKGIKNALKLTDWIKEHLGKIETDGSIKNFAEKFKEVGEKVKNAVGDALDVVKQGPYSAWEKFNSFIHKFNDITGTVKDAIETALDAGDLLSKISTFISKFSSIGSTIIEAITNALGSTKVQGAFSSFLSFAVGLYLGQAGTGEGTSDYLSGVGWQATYDKAYEDIEKEINKINESIKAQRQKISDTAIDYYASMAANMLKRGDANTYAEALQEINYNLYNMLPSRFIQSFAKGGIINGLLGKPIPIIAHAGEEVLPRSDPRHSENNGGGIFIQVTGNTIMNDNDADKLATVIVNSITRRARLQQKYTT